MNKFIIGDFIARLNIAKNSHMKSIIIDQSKVILVILKLFENLGIIRGYRILNNLNVEVLLKYNQSISVIQNIKLISKPRKRVYVDIIKLNKLKDKYIGDILILSTNQGILVDIECVKKNIGGEVILKITL